MARTARVHSLLSPEMGTSTTQVGKPARKYQRTVNAHEKAPVVAAGLYLKGEARDGLGFAVGNMIADSTVMLVVDTREPRASLNGTTVS